MTETTRKELDKRIDDAISTLSEFADTVQIFASKVDDETGSANTSYWNCGAGNIYARIGQAREWVIVMDERARRDARDKEPDP